MKEFTLLLVHSGTRGPAVGWNIGLIPVPLSTDLFSSLRKVSEGRCMRIRLLYLSPPAVFSYSCFSSFTASLSNSAIVVCCNRTQIRRYEQIQCVHNQQDVIITSGSETKRGYRCCTNGGAYSVTFTNYIIVPMKRIKIPNEITIFNNI